MGKKATEYQPDQLLSNRYLCKSSRIFLDTKPGLVPDAIADIPQDFVRYLRLSPYQIHIPQIYEILPSGASADTDQILLLGQASVYVPLNSTDVQPLPCLLSAWQTASALRQLNWLWQIAQLWQPLNAEQTASSLLMPDLLRIEGPLIRLLELHPDDPKTVPTLVQLGQVWATWVADAQTAIAAFLEQLCQHLVHGEIRNAEQLVSALDQGLAVVGQGQSRQLQIATLTDQGPTRQRNEDACYPPSGTVKTQTISTDQTAADPALAIVCDGIGGHQGGNVASNLAIATAQEQLQSLHPERLDANALTTELEQMVWAANDQISQRNDSEQRFERQRMGTTLVMGLVRAHELYTSHVGDSRVYWITRWNCRQVTLDDDIAAREVRLGYSSYREALQQPGAGSLVQALGMGASTLLHPTVQRFILDEDCVFLLCSDGLSDNDRVEEVWETEIVPLLDGKVDVTTASQRLVAIANTLNGHDNVTVALMYCQVTQQPAPDTLPPLAPPIIQTTSPPQIVSNPVLTASQADTPMPSAASLAVASRSAASTLKTQLVPPPRKPSPLPLLLSILVLLGIGGLLAYFLLPSVSRWIDPLVGLRPGAVPDASNAPTVAASPTEAGLPLQTSAFIRVDRPSVPANSPTDAVTISPPLLLPEPTSPEATPISPSAIGGKVVPWGSILQVQAIRRQGTSAQEGWVRVQVCSVPNMAATAPTPTANKSPKPNPVTATAPAGVLQPGEIGWIQETVALPLVSAGADLTPAQQGSCLRSPMPAPPLPEPAPIPHTSPIS